jgi:hypothetical protein
VREAFASVHWPQVTIGINPRGIGLVGLPSVFWVEGYDGLPFGARETADVEPEVDPRVPLSVVPAGDPRRQAHRLEVEVRVRPPARYRWSFGDGATASFATLGRPYTPDAPRSEIQHQYEYTSFYEPGGFLVAIEADFAISYSVSIDGASETYDLGTSSVRYARRYPVQEIQGVLLAPNAVLGR